MNIQQDGASGHDGSRAATAGIIKNNYKTRPQFAKLYIELIIHEHADS